MCLRYRFCLFLLFFLLSNFGSDSVVFFVLFLILFVLLIIYLAIFTCLDNEWEIQGDFCYTVLKNQANGANYQEGKSLCEDEGANVTLVMPKTDAENEKITEIENRYVFLQCTLSINYIEG